MGKTKTYPRIWDRNTEWKIVGETRVSWLVLMTDRSVEHIEERLNEKWFVDRYITKVSKKNPNIGSSAKWPRWFFDEAVRNDFLFLQAHQTAVGERVRFGEITAEQLRKIAEIIGYNMIAAESGTQPGGEGPTTEAAMASESAAK